MCNKNYFVKNGDYYMNTYTCGAREQDQSTEFTIPNSSSEFRQNTCTNNDWDEYSIDSTTVVSSSKQADLSFLPNTNPRFIGRYLGDSSAIRRPKVNDTSDICVIAGSEIDNDLSLGQEDLLQRLWISAKPPTKMSVRKPLVTARQLEIVRGQLTGELPRKSRNSGFRCDEDARAQICKYVGIVKGKKMKNKN